MSRREFFYAPPEQISGDEVQLLGAEHAHCTRVLGKAVGDALTVVDGAGNAFDGVIAGVEKSRTRMRITRRRERVGEPVARLTLAQAVPKGSRFDWLIEKGTEIGVSVFIPLRCERSEVTASNAKRARWQRLALAAMKQSCRSVVPVIAAEQLLEEVCACARQYDFALLAEESSANMSQVLLAGILEPHRGREVRGLLLVGPEGGFSDAELEMARQSNVRLLALGARRLRAETAGLVASTLVLAGLGELD